MLSTVSVLFILGFTEISEQRGRDKRATSAANVNNLFNRFKFKSAGEGTYYGTYPTGTGACSMDPLPPVYTQKNWIKVAAGYDDYQKSLGCGMCLKVTGTGKGSGSNPIIGPYYAVVVDLCDGCKQGDLDLYIPGDGRWDISFEAIDCPTLAGNSGKIKLRFTGSNPWYIKLQVSNSKLPTAALELHHRGKWHCMKRAADNHFVINGIGRIKSPMRVRLTSITGETLGVTLPELINTKYQNSGVQYKPFRQAAKGSPPKLRCYGQGGLAVPGKPDEVTNQGGSGNDGPTKPTPSGTGGRASTKGTPGTGVTGRPEDFCKMRANGLYTDPWDCKGFLKCAEKKTHRFKCPGTLRFNPRVMNCDHPQNVKC